MPQAASYDIVIRQGNTLRRTFRFLNEDGTPINLTGSVMRFRVELGSRTGKSPEEIEALIADVFRRWSLI